MIMTSPRRDTFSIQSPVSPLMKRRVPSSNLSRNWRRLGSCTTERSDAAAPATKREVASMRAADEAAGFQAMMRLLSYVSWVANESLIEPFGASVHLYEALGTR